MWQPEHTKVVLLAHVLTTVPAEDLEHYLLSKGVSELLVIGHPLFYKEGRPGPYCKRYVKGALVSKLQYKNRKFPSLVQYAKDVGLTLLWVIRTRQRWDVLIALDNLNAITGLMLRAMGIVRKVVYYTIDYVPQRFENKLLNDAYHYVDKISVGHADRTWNLTDRVAEGREQVRKLPRDRYNRQVTVPIGIWFHRIPRKQFEEIAPHTLAYAGGLSEHQGIQLVIDAIPLIIKKIPDFKFVIIGLGNYESVLKKKAHDLAIDAYVNFLGYMERHEEVEERLSHCGLAVAMYSKELSKWSYYADPSKIKTYLATGLPVITTSLTYIADQLVTRGCGTIVEYDAHALADAIITIMTQPEHHREMRDHAGQFASEFDWMTVFDRGMSAIDLT